MNRPQITLPSYGAPIRYRCGVCSDSGVVLARARNTQERGFGVYAFKCGCSAGHFDRRGYPSWAGSDGFEAIR